MLTDSQIKKETERLFENLSKVGWSETDCEIIAPMTLEINQLKKETDTIILAHSYMTPDIIYGVADLTGDSYGLSKAAKETQYSRILFCSVHFMAETAKILNPEKEVLVPDIAGCSLADSITPEDVKALRKQHPEAGVVCYVNTSAEVKAECDSCCTSSNALKIIETMPQKEIIFLPDKYMAKNLQKLTRKKLITWHGKCIVHEEFSVGHIKEVRTQYPKAKILAHAECNPQVIEKVDKVGGTSNMIDFIKTTKFNDIMLVTECGLSERMRIEYPQKNIVGTCALCPFMKKIMLKKVLQALKNPQPNQFIRINPNIIHRAKKSLLKMIELTEKKPVFTKV